MHTWSRNLAEIERTEAWQRSFFTVDNRPKEPRPKFKARTKEIADSIVIWKKRRFIPLAVFKKLSSVPLLKHLVRSR